MAGIRDRFRTGADGKERKYFQIDYVDADGKRRRRDFTSYRAAKAALMELQDEVAAKRANPGPMPGDITVGEACDNWLARCQSGRGKKRPLEPATVTRYRGHVENHIRPAIGHLRVRELTSAHIEALATAMLTGEDLVGHSMVEKVLDSASSAIKIETRRLKILNPFEELETDDDGRTQQEIVAPSREDIGRMLDAAAKLAVQEVMPQVAKAWQRYHPFLLVTIYTGARMSEVRGLVWENILWDQSAIKISQRADESNVIGPTKTKRSQRTIPVPPKVIAALKAWREVCPAAANDIKTFEHRRWRGATDLVFPTGTGRIESLSNIVSRCWIPLMKKAGLWNPVTKQSAYNRHQMRHFFATMHIHQGATIKDIQYLMGHSTITMTMDTYGHIFEGLALDEERRVRVAAIAEHLDGFQEAARIEKAGQSMASM